MKIKIITKNDVVLSKYDYETMTQNILEERALKEKARKEVEKLKDDYAVILAKTIKLESSLKNQRRLAFTLSEENLKLKQDNAEDKKVVKKLKALCTRNMVDYSKVVEKEEETNGTRGKKAKKTV